MDACRNCVYWRFREMIQKPYGYVGDIPCLRCKRLSEPQDLFTPIQQSMIGGVPQINSNDIPTQ